MKKSVMIAIAVSVVLFAGGNVLDNIAADGGVASPAPRSGVAAQQVQQQNSQQSPVVVVDEKGNVNLKKSMDNLIDKKLEQIYRLIGELQKTTGGKKRKKKIKHYKKPSLIAGFLHIENHRNGKKFRDVYAYDENGGGVYLNKRNDKGIRSISFNNEYVLYKDKKIVRLVHLNGKNGAESYKKEEQGLDTGARMEVTPPQPVPVPAAVAPLIQNPGEKKIEDIVGKEGF